jgi:uncharacterized protein (TIGR01244 family)
MTRYKTHFVGPSKTQDRPGSRPLLNSPITPTHYTVSFGKIPPQKTVRARFFTMIQIKPCQSAINDRFGPLKAKQISPRHQRLNMDIRALTPDYAVSPQIAPEDLPALKAAGYSVVINNRPDGEIPPHLRTDVMQSAAQALGLVFVVNPVIGGAMTMQNVDAQRAAVAQATGPVFAYCASGNRSSVVWALAHAGTIPTDDLIDIPARFGYNLEPFRAQIAVLAQK